MPSNLFIAGTLLISPLHPAHFPSAQPQVWLSNSKKIEAQSLNSGLILKARESGLLFAVGIDKSPLKILVTSDENYLALKSCPRAPVSLEQGSPRLQDFRRLIEIKACEFNDLSLSEADQKTHELDFERAERSLSEAGIYQGRRSWLVSGKRRLNYRDSEAKVRIKRLLGALSPFYELVLDHGPKPGRTLVFQLTLFEFSRSKARQLGLKFPSSIKVKNLEGNLAEWKASSGTADSLEVGADFGESLGVGKILAQPQIRTKPGEKAIFQSGGEIPIKNNSAYQSNTSWKNYGLIVQLEPDANLETGATEVSLGFKVELSEPDQATALDGVPGMIVRRLESRFDLRTNETTVLTSMIQSRSGANRSGIAGLMHIPLLGRLLSDQSDNEQGSELWFSMRPSWEEILNESQGDRSWL